MHSFIQTGFNESDDAYAKYFKLMLETINAKIDSLSKKISKENMRQVKLDLLNKLIKSTTQKLDTSKGVFYLFAFPTKDVVIKNFWEQGNKSVYHFIKNTPYLREMGWDLRVAMSEYPYPSGDKWEITNGNRKLTNFDIQGRLFSAGSIDGFLDWGAEDYIDKKLNLVNAFALTEYIDNFFHTLEVLKTVFNVDSDYEIEAGFIFVDDSDIKLLFPPHIQYASHYITDTIKKKRWKIKIKRADNRHPSYFAGQLVQEIYVTGFDYVEQQYPYLIKDSKGYAVNEQLYIKQN